MTKILCVVGARPNYMKVAPIMRGLGQWPGCQPILVHTGQHYDANMSDVFFQDLELPKPDIWLGIGSGTHAEQTARVMLGFEPVMRQQEPDMVLVVGDVNSTLACTLVAVKLGVRVAHVEAGLRSFDRTMPEEINRLVTDALADLLFTPSEDGDSNLRREGIPAERIYCVGNVMADSLAQALPLVKDRPILASLGLPAKRYGLMTLHRPGNVDSRESLSEFTQLVAAVAALAPLVVPLHPRTTASLKKFALLERWEGLAGLRLLPPLGYLDFVALMSQAAYVLTDSGGIQEETTILNVPCLTLRPNTERPVTVSLGTNTLVGDDQPAVLEHVRAILAGRGKPGRLPPLWDGHAADRIVDILRQRNWPRSTG